MLQTRNNYDLEVFNGDSGIITHIDLVEQQIRVNIDGRTVAYDWADANELTHAYAISVHRSQGSEYPVVVLPVVTQHYHMLQRNLVYGSYKGTPTGRAGGQQESDCHCCEEQ